MSDSSAYLEMTADVVSAFVSKNSIQAADLPSLLHSVHESIQRLGKGIPEVPVEEPKAPAVPIKKSVMPDYIICLEDGRKFKSLKRHLTASYNLTAEQYREKWKLPVDYPMVAPNYAAARSALAKSSGLGQKIAARKTAKR